MFILHVDIIDAAILALALLCLFLIGVLWFFSSFLYRVKSFLKRRGRS